MADNNQYSSQVLSTKNSSNQTILPGFFFEGQWESIDGFETVNEYVLTNQSGILYLNFSNDANYLLETKTISVTASVATNQNIDLGSYKYFKVRFKNTGGVQSSFSLETTYNSGGTYDLNVTGSTLPSGAATSALQQQQITETEGTNTLLDDIKSSVSTYEGQQQIIDSIVSANQKSYDSNDKFDLMLEELMEIKKILKKIYA